ncbi:MAG: restriction endonuclease subunit S [Verrucomicrobiota bacterium]
MSKWQKMRLGELGEVNRGRSRHRPRYAEHLYGGQYPFIQTGDIKASNGRITSHQQTYSEAGLAQSRLWPAGTLCITIAANIAETGILSYPACFPDSVVGFVADQSKCEVLFIEYMFRHLRRQIQHEATGSVQDNINLETLNRLEIPLPPLPEQRAIAAVLGALDDKIELNRRMNETLEALAQSLFKSWFVDAVQDGLPKGWREVPLPQAIEVNPPRPLRKGVVAPYLDMANMPTRSARALEVVDREFGSGMRFKNGDTLVARITPCLENGKTCFVDFLNDSQIAWGSTEYIVLKPKPPLPPEFAYFLTRTEEFRAFMISNMTGTSGRQRVPAECLSNFKIAVPPAELAEKFGKFAASAFAHMKAHDEESRTLAVLRDALLPKLLSGELRLPAQMLRQAGVPAAGKSVNQIA